MASIQVVLSCYPKGTPTSPIDLGKEWQTFNQQSPPGFDVGPSTLVILHPGDKQVFSAWTDWANDRKDVALMAVSRDPSAFDGVLKSKKKEGKALPNCHAYHRPLVWENEPMPRRQEWFSNLRDYMNWVNDQSFPVDDKSVTSLWEPLDKRRDADIGHTRELLKYAGAVVISAVDGPAAAMQWCEVNFVKCESMDECFASYLQLDLTRGPDVLCYSVQRQRLSHVELLNRVMATLTGVGGNVAHVKDAWGGLKADFYDLAEWARLALTPDPIVRAALYFADPRNHPTLVGNDGEVWTAPLVNLAERKNAQAMDAATKVLDKASKSLTPNPRIEAYMAALDAFSFAMDSSNDTDELRTKGEAFKGTIQNLRASHGERG